MKVSPWHGAWYGPLTFREESCYQSKFYSDATLVYSILLSPRLAPRLSSSGSWGSDDQLQFNASWLKFFPESERSVPRSVPRAHFQVISLLVASGARLRARPSAVDVILPAGVGTRARSRAVSAANK